MGKGASLQLRDIHLPDAISWWPPAPGWWGLLLLVVLIVLSIRALFEIKKRREARASALKSLEKLTGDFAENQNQGSLVSGLSVLLRRICLSYYPRKEVAGLSGEAWLSFLDTHLGKSNQGEMFSKGPGQILITAPYQANIEIDGQALLSLCKNWIKTLPPKERPKGGFR